MKKAHDPRALPIANKIKIYVSLNGDSETSQGLFRKDQDVLTQGRRGLVKERVKLKERDDIFKNTI